MIASRDRLETLTAINLDDLVNAFGWKRRPLLAFLVRIIFSNAARSFAGQMLDFDTAIGSCGLAQAARLTERLYVRDVSVVGADLLPDGPILALSNHPGLTDTLALMASLGRPDLRIIALDRPFLLSLPNLSSKLFFVTDQPSERSSLVRRVSQHLREGGSILTFPAGSNEPDPDVYSGAVEALREWTESVGVFVRLAPETALVPVCVRGVIWKKMAQHPFVLRKHTQDDRQLLASSLQLLSSILFKVRPVSVQVQIGTPIMVKDLGSTATSVIHKAVLTEMRRLIEVPLPGRGVTIL